MNAANEARLARLAEVHEQLTGAVAALSSSAEWQRIFATVPGGRASYQRTASRFAEQLG